MDRTLVAIIASSIFQVALNLVLLAFSYGRLLQKVEILWMAVFNHLGQSENEMVNEWLKKRKTNIWKSRWQR